VNQYNVVPYGFKNILSAFIRALDKAVGDGLADNVVTYVDDVVVHSGCSEDHLRHLDRLSGLLVRVSGYRYRGPGFDPRRYQIF